CNATTPGTGWDVAEEMRCYDGDNCYGANMPSNVCPSPPAGGNPLAGHLSMWANSAATHNGYTEISCYHPNGMLHGQYRYAGEPSDWSNTLAVGVQMIYDVNGNLTEEFVGARPASRSASENIVWVYNTGSMQDRVQYIKHKEYSASTFTDITMAN